MTELGTEKFGRKFVFEAIMAKLGTERFGLRPDEADNDQVRIENFG